MKIKVQEYEERLQEEKRIHEDKIQRMHENMEEYRNEVLIETSTLETQICELKSENEHFQDVMKAKNDTLLTKCSEIEVKEKALQQKDASISGLNEELTKAREYLATRKQVRICNELLSSRCVNSYHHFTTIVIPNKGLE